MKVTIVAADDHEVTLIGIRRLLEAEPDFEVVGEATDGLAVAPLVERLRPAVLVLDLKMPGINGLEITRLVTERAPKTRVVFLSIYGNESYVVEALRNGASAYVLKDAVAAELVRAIRAALAGRRYLSPPLSDDAIDAYLQRAQESPADLYETLTAREREVLHLTAQGNTTPEIATRLFLSQRTVETHRANLMRKLRLRNHAQVIRYALQRGLVPLDT
ncbi:MAG TPA: response regulator transcription factor [Armatimonadota bacterium]|nr:response regulator transcription factor [Armatimonadota bacterium]